MSSLIGDSIVYGGSWTSGVLREVFEEIPKNRAWLEIRRHRRRLDELVARWEGILLDTTYTAKAFGGYIADARAGRFAGIDRAVFLHTGGEPALFVGPG
jgi:hypothetical protein